MLTLMLSGAMGQPAVRTFTGGKSEASPESKEAKIRVSGTVVDEAGKPLAGAVVEYFNVAKPRAEGQMNPDETATTREDGKFEFKAPAVSLVVFAAKPGLAPSWWSVWNPSADLDEQISLLKPVTISGTVLDDESKPVPDAKVWLTTGYLQANDGSRSTHYVPTMPHQDLYSARTGADGKFKIEGCPGNAGFDLEVSTPGKTLRSLERQYVGPDSMRWRPGQKDLKLVVELAGTVEGKVRSFASGEPLGKATVSLQVQNRSGAGFRPPRPARTGADGIFRFAEVPPGSYSVLTRLESDSAQGLVAENVNITVAAGRATRDLEIPAIKPGFLSVKTVGKEDRKSISGLGVSAWSSKFSAGQATDQEGMATLALAPGSYQVSAYRENMRIEPQTVEVREGATNSVILELEPPQRITGVVLDPAGKPAADVQLRVLPEYRANTGAIKSDTQGRFSFPWNRQSVAANQSCSLMARDTRKNLAAAVELDADAKEVELKLQPGLTVSGRVEDIKGKPLAKATVQIFFWNGNMGSSFDNTPLRTDADGKFQIAALPPGHRYSAQGTAKGFGSQSQQISAEESGNVDLAAFVLNVADRKLAGQVVDADDKPVSGAWVNMYGQGQPNASIRSDSEGFFKFDEVCEGSIQLSASAERAYGNVRAEAGDTNVVLKLGVNSYSTQQAPRRPSLKGKPLPDLVAAGLPADCAPAGKPVLLCLFDIDQRPSRRFIRQLTEQHDGIVQKGVTVIGLQAAVATAEAVKEWKDSNPVPFQVGLVTENRKEVKWATDVESVPWLILADKNGRVHAEGFTLEELDTRLKELSNK